LVVNHCTINLMNKLSFNLKREIVIHFLSLLVFFALITLFKKWFTDPRYLFFWLGGLLGTLLPDLDHLIYVYLIHPQELTSQRVTRFIEQRQIKETAEILYRTKNERSKLIFHTIWFQLLFLIFSLFVVTSSGSLIGTGLVLSFLLHLVIDQLVDFLTLENLDKWLTDLPLSSLTPQVTVFYLILNFLFLFLLAFLF